MSKLRKYWYAKKKKKEKKNHVCLNLLSAFFIYLWNILYKSYPNFDI